LAVRPRQIAPVALVLGLTIAGFVGTRLDGEHDARRESEHRLEVAAAQIRDRIAQATSLTESLRRFMLDASGTGLTSDQFARNASRWLSPGGFPAAGLVEQVPDARRAAYERRIGQPIVTRDDRRRVGSRSSYLPATLVSGFSPMALPGIDLSAEPGMAAALARATRVHDVAATRFAAPRNGTSGFFLVAPAPTLVEGILRPGYVVLFVSAATLRAAATDAPAVRITAPGISMPPAGGAGTVSKTITGAAQRFDIAVPKESVNGAAAALPWIILAAGLVLAMLAAAVEINRARRAKAQEQLDRIFTVSTDLITVADFDGRFMRVNPAAERILGYSEQELVARPYVDFVHPDDRAKTLAEAAAITGGRATLAFENRYVRKDGTYRVLEWTTTPVVEDRVMYAVARDVTERREAAAELERLAGEQAALRRVATLVARQASQAEVVEAIADELGRLLGTELFSIVRYEDDGIAVVVASTGVGADAFAAVGSRHRLGGKNAISRVFETRRSVRIDDYADASGAVGAAVRSIGVTSVVATPIMLEGRLWGAMLAATTRPDPVPPETEPRLEQFIELMATAIANTESFARAERLREEQAALRRVATLVARQASQSDVFGAIADEIGQLLGTKEFRMMRYEEGHSAVVVAASGQAAAVFPVGSRHRLGGDNAASRVFRTAQAVRIDDYADASGPIGDEARADGVSGTVAAPILVDGRVWGVMTAGALHDEPLARDLESRLGQFSELMATAVANREAHARADRLAEEQAALRRVATLVAQSAPPSAVLDAVAGEMQALLESDQVAVNRFEPGEEIHVLAHRGLDVERTPVGSRVSIKGESVTAAVRRTGRPARMEDYGRAPGPLAQLARATGLRSSVSAPIVVEGRPWGLITASWKRTQSPPADTEERMTKFTDLVGTAIANSEARSEVERLAEEQAALRRVATLVAEGATPDALFDAVVAEMDGLLDADGVLLSRYEAHDEITVVAHRGTSAEVLPPGTRVSVEPETLTATVRRTKRPARIERYDATRGAFGRLAEALGVRSAVGAPIVVEGRLWGVVVANWKGDQSPPADTEHRMAQFAELLDTAIANADTRDQLTASRVRLVTAGDDARRRVVRDLHDGAQQRMVHTIVTLKLAQRAFGQEDGDPEPLVREALMHAEQGNQDLRELSHGILPAALTHGGLQAGVDSLAARLAVPVDVDVAPERFAAEIEASAYFVIAEALTNVVKHAHAEHAVVKVGAVDGMLRIEVRDDGTGGANPEGHGLLAMSDRVTALGGRLDIETRAGNGTLLVATLPLPADAQE
jgi:PAS domain S-box-containing protein